MPRSATPGFYTRKFENRPRSLALIGRANSGMHENFQIRSKFCTPRGISSVAPAKLCQSQKFLPHECIPEKTPANQSASERPIFENFGIKPRGRRPGRHNQTQLQRWPSPPPRSPPRRPSPRAAPRPRSPRPRPTRSTSTRFSSRSTPTPASPPRPCPS